jgi:antitoxin ParD1/3/4
MASIALGDHCKNFIRKQLESGRYNNASGVVRAGLRMLEDFESSRGQWIEMELGERLAEYGADAGRAIPAERVFAELEEHHRSRAGDAKGQ